MSEFREFDFVEFLFDEGDFITLRPIGDAPLGDWHQTVSREEFDDAFESYRDFCDKNKANAYYGVCPRFGRRENETSWEKRWQIRKANFFWLDIDHITPEDAVARIEAAGVPEPSVIVSTGNGVHLYWRLAESLQFIQNDPPALHHIKINGERSEWYVDEYDEWVYFVSSGIKHNNVPVPDLSEDALMVEDINNGLGKILDGDNCGDVSRILRLPGTQNYKDQVQPKPCEIYEFSGKTYSIEDFDFALEISPSRKRREAESKMSLPTINFATEKSLGKGRTAKLQSYLDDLTVVAEGERSDADWKLLCWSVEEGIDPEFVWSKVSDLSKFAARGRRYFDTTLHNARSAVKAKRYDEAQSRKPPEPGSVAVGTGMIAVEDVTDLRVAEIVADENAGRIVYCHDLGDWLAYRDGRFAANESGVDVQTRIVTSVRGLPDRLTGDDKQDVVRRYEAAPAIGNVEKLAKRNPKLSSSLSKFDQKPMLLNVKNGTIDLSKKPVAFRDHSPEDRLTKMAGVEYDPEAKCPRWEAFLRKVLVDPETQKPSEELYKFMQVYLGTFLSGRTEAQIVGVLWGSGKNGKSTLTETLCSVLGDYAVSPSSEILLKKRNKSSGQASPDLMLLRGARMVACQEIDEGNELDEAGVKTLTGGDEITARGLFSGYVSWEPTHQILLATNNKPVVTGGDVGIWRRLKLIPFAYKIPEREQIQHFGEQLLEEAPGILNWLIAGWQEFADVDGKIEYPEIVEVATKNFRDDSDVVGEFVEERCRVGVAFCEPAQGLYDAYVAYAQEKKVEIKGRNTFYVSLEGKGFVKTKRKQGQLFNGLRLCTDDELEDRERIARGEDLF